MWRFGLRQAGRLALGLLGAVLLAALVSASGMVGHHQGLVGYAGEVGARLLAMSRLDFGLSNVSAAPASMELVRRLPATLELVGLGAIVAVAIGAPVGLLLSAGRGLQAGAPLIQIVAAAPVFCAGLGLLWLSERVLHWSGMPRGVSLLAALASGDSNQIQTAFHAVALPTLTVGAAGAASVQLTLRRAIAEAADAPYRRTLHAMGLGRFEVDLVYLVPQVLANLLESLGEIASSLLAAAAVAEWVFNWPGAADLFLKSVALRDWAVVGLVLLVFAGLTMIVEFAGIMSAHVLAQSERFS